jgi:hypothetical protein
MTDTPARPDAGTKLEFYDVTPRDLDRLESIEWGEDNFGSLTTNRQFPRRAMLRLVDMGLARSIGQVVACDDDGWQVEPEQFREGFVLTEAGRKAVAARRAQFDAAFTPEGAER